ncbi:MAG: ABC transporter ATP-binding protein [Planctomycetota bacterium]|jgi:phospholipid/cholesterol/gamma-HCH transport system ATP-binding protein
MPYLLELDAVSCITAERRFFENVSLKLEPGVVLCIVGASGQGKSMLCRVAAGLSLPTSGTVRLLGRETKSCSYTETKRLRQKIGYVFQRSALITNMTVEDNIALPLLYHTTLTKGEIHHKVHDILDSMEITDAARMRPADLPEVATQRANIARSLVLEPSILFIDEPHEDTGFGRRIQRFIKPLLKRVTEERGTGVFMASRDVHFAYRTADRIGFMEDGILVEEGTVEELSLSRQSTRVGFLSELTSHISRMRAEEEARKGNLSLSQSGMEEATRLKPVTRFGVRIDNEGNPVIPPAIGKVDLRNAQNADDAPDKKEEKTASIDQSEIPDVDLKSPGENDPAAENEQTEE